MSFFYPNGCLEPGHRRRVSRPEPQKSAILRVTSPVRFLTDICPTAVRFSGHLTDFGGI
jgi:hypothetical protein